MPSEHVRGGMTAVSARGPGADGTVRGDAVVRRVAEEEFPAWWDTAQIGFLTPERRGEGPRWRRHVDLGRCWGAFDGPRPLGVLRSKPLDLTVPGGGTVAVSGLCSAAVLPSHRRQGLLRALMSAELTAAEERGEPACALIAAEWPVYGRFGFGAAAEGANITLDAGSARLRPDLSVPDTVRLVDHETFRTEAEAVHERVRARVPGAVSRTAEEWHHCARLALDPGDPPPADVLYALAHDVDGRATGYVVYAPASRPWTAERPDHRIDLLELTGDGPRSEAALWRFLWEHDWVTQVDAWNRPVDEPLPWMLQDARSMRQIMRSDTLWLRILSVPGLLSARRYEVSGSLVVRIRDPRGPADGTYLLEGGPTEARCVRSTRGADVTLPVATLASLYLGSLSAVRAAQAGLLVEERAGAVALLDRMFRTALAPWAVTKF
ncbi:GNAT family N-acetyltransferase [Streptomyces sp. NPDC093591]|uniref:GNAT family N-acetyltransferase n=1 Tax=Streptomyces sp. NPDC093591 TaxID=3366044 RepID=UPI003805E853